MRKRIRLLATVLATVCTLGVLSGCDDFEDFVPDEYGEWDGNYVYAGNVKSKTTGENPERLVSKVTIGERIYEINRCSDYEIVGENMYMCLSAVYSQSGENAEIDEKTCLVRYDMERKTSTLIYAQRETVVEKEKVVYDLEKIVKVLSDGVILQSNKQGWYKIDMTGAIVDEDCDEFQYYYQAGEDYLYQLEGTKLTYRTWEDETPRVAFDGAAISDAVSFQERYVEKKDCKGFLVQMDELSGGCRGLYFYDLRTGELTKLDFSGLGERVEWLTYAPESEYFLTYHREWVTYTASDGLFQRHQATATQPKDCVLWRVVYDADGVKIEKAYTFDREKDFTNIRAVYGDTLYVQAEWYALASGCNGGGRQEAYYRIRMQSGEEKRITDKALDAGANELKEAIAREPSVTCGQYDYYIRTQTYVPAWGSPHYVYTFNRFDGEEMDVMQIWATTAQEEENYCEEMWRQVDTEYSYEAIEYEFVVREN